MDINVIFLRISMARAGIFFFMLLIRHEFTAATRIAKINTQ